MNICFIKTCEDNKSLILIKLNLPLIIVSLLSIYHFIINKRSL